ncbi:hypothetical protein Tco_0178948 [Tanacetum coccineum]
MSSSNHPIIIPSDFDIEDAFSFINVPDYFAATPENTSPDFSNDLTKYLLATLVFSPLHDDPYMKVIQAYDVISPPQVTTPPLVLLPPSLLLSLSPMFDSRDFFPPEENSPPKDIETHVESPIPISLSSSVGSSSPVRSTTPPPDYPFDESIFAELDHSLWIIPRPLGSEPVSLYPKTYWELLPKEILGATTQRDTRSYYPKRYWELLPKEILGAITQRETGMSYGKMEGNLIDGKSISSEMRPYGSTMLSTRTGKFSISSERKQLRHATWGTSLDLLLLLWKG